MYRFHLEIHPALLSEELKEELSLLPKGLLHLEAGIQSLREPVLEKSRRMGKLSDALDGLRFLCALPNMETHADLIAGLPLYHLHEIFEDVRTLAGYVTKKDTISVTEDTEKTITMEKAPESTRKDVSAAWKNFRNSDDNMGITSAKTPTSEATTYEKWFKKLGSGWMPWNIPHCCKIE